MATSDCAASTRAEFATEHDRKWLAGLDTLVRTQTTCTAPDSPARRTP